MWQVGEARRHWVAENEYNAMLQEELERMQVLFVLPVPLSTVCTASTSCTALCMYCSCGQGSPCAAVNSAKWPGRDIFAFYTCVLACQYTAMQGQCTNGL